MLVTRSEIESFERLLEDAIRTGSADRLQVIGYGEVTIAVKLSTPRGDFACKRLVPFTTRRAAEQTAALIATYVSELEACGLDVLETETPVLETPLGHVLHVVQPMLAPATLAPNVLRRKSADEAEPYVRRIFGHIAASVTPTLAPDGQLSNWAVDGERIRYLDVGTPFLRDERGNDLFDFTQQTRALPAPIRVIVDRFLLREILDNYHSIRGQGLDFLGNLIKEGLSHLLVPLLSVANEVFALSPALTEREVRVHYRSDARTYALIQAARRADRWVFQNLLRRPYPYLLPPRIDRFAEQRSG